MKKVKEEIGKVILTIEATNTKDGHLYHWNRGTIGNIINNIPKLIELDGIYEDIKIYKI